VARALARVPQRLAGAAALALLGLAWLRAMG